MQDRIGRAVVEPEGLGARGRSRRENDRDQEVLHVLQWN